MVSVIISEGILLIASVILAGAISAVALNQIGLFQSSFSMQSSIQRETALTKIKIIYASNSSSNNLLIWMKNIGGSPLKALDSVDVFFGPIGSIHRVSHNVADTPKWTYASSLSQLQVKETVQINLSTDAPLQKNVSYAIRITTPNGVSDEYIFSLD